MQYLSGGLLYQVLLVKEITINGVPEGEKRVAGKDNSLFNQIIF
jgi:hypothetical protein